jgi:hypothetical protein
MQPNDALENYFIDIHSVNGVLKLLFRQLQDILISSSLYECFNDSTRMF